MKGCQPFLGLLQLVDQNIFTQSVWYLEYIIEYQAVFLQRVYCTFGEKCAAFPGIHLHLIFVYLFSSVGYSTGSSGSLSQALPACVCETGASPAAAGLQCSGIHDVKAY